MDLAIEEAYVGIREGDGGPFGAVVVRNGRVIARGHNVVVAENDPTAHAEIVAIRRAGRELGRFDLSDCTIFSTCEPCPMCRAAIHWARIGKIVYGCDRTDAARIGFDDALLYRLFANGNSAAPSNNDDAVSGTGNIDVREHVDECRALFDTFAGMENRVRY